MQSCTAMSVQWHGPAAEAAKVALKADLKWRAERETLGVAGQVNPDVAKRSGWNKRSHRVPLSGGALGTPSEGSENLSWHSARWDPTGVIMVLLPWLMFSSTTSLYIFSMEDFPTVVWFLFVLCGLFSVSMIVAGTVAKPATLLNVGVWSAASFCMALFLGRSLYQDCLSPYYQLRNLAHVRDADPSTVLVPEVKLGDAAVLNFLPGTFVDNQRTVGYVSDGTIFCVAPVVRRGTFSTRVAYWAVGTDCCEARSNFDCGAARQHRAREAVSYRSSEDDQFKRAVDVARATFALELPQDVRFVRFVNNASDELENWLMLAYTFAGFASLIHLVWTVVVVSASKRIAVQNYIKLLDAEKQVLPPTTLTLPPTLPGMDRLPPTSKIGNLNVEDYQMPPPADRIQYDPTNDPFIRGGAAKDPSFKRKNSPASPMSVESTNTAFEAEYCFERNKEDPHFFSNVVIAADGGLSEVEQNYKDQTWIDFISAAITPCFIFYNVIYITSIDTQFITQPNPEFDQMYLLSTSLILQPIVHMYARITGHQDHFSVRAQQMFAIFELLGMVYYIMWIVVGLLRLYWMQPWHKWSTVHTIYWDTLPRLSTYSLMGFLGEVCPTVFFTNFEQEFASVTRDNVITAKEWGTLSRFVLRHLVYAIIGFDAFLVKFRLSTHFVTGDEIGLWEVLGAGNFVMQLVGVVKMGSLVQRRLFVFMFAGEDCVLEEKDETNMRAYNALLTWRIWQVSKSWFHFNAIMLNFNDYDFQRLVLNTSHHSHSSTPGGTSKSESGSIPELSWKWPWRSPQREVSEQL